MLLLVLTPFDLTIQALSSPQTTPSSSRRAWLQKSAASAALVLTTTPATSRAAPADCFQDCLKNCRQIAPKDPAYCNQNCRDYCDQPDRTGE